jgi:hypothetical protein
VRKTGSAVLIAVLLVTVAAALTDNVGWTDTHRTAQIRVAIVALPSDPW